MIRAKFKCMSVAEQYDGSWHVKLMPVYKGSGGNYEENKAFWEYTPAGEVALVYATKPDFVPNGLYYIDFERLAGDVLGWRLTHREEWSKKSAAVELSLWPTHAPALEPLKSGSAKMSLQAAPAIAAFAPIESAWAVSFTFAEMAEDKNAGFGCS